MSDKSELVAKEFRPSFQMVVALVAAVVLIFTGLEHAEKWVKKLAREEWAPEQAQRAGIAETHQRSLDGHEARLKALEAQAVENGKALVRIEGAVESVRNTLERRK